MLPFPMPRPLPRAAPKGTCRQYLNPCRPSPPVRPSPPASAEESGGDELRHIASSAGRRGDGQRTVTVPAVVAESPTLVNNDQNCRSALAPAESQSATEAKSHSMIAEICRTWESVERAV